MIGDFSVDLSTMLESGDLSTMLESGEWKAPVDLIAVWLNFDRGIQCYSK